jgi:hypothetical protein
MVQSVKRTADLAPTEDNDAATMAMADAAMTVLGWLSGAGEHLLGEEGWFICTADGMHLRFSHLAHVNATV